MSERFRRFSRLRWKPSNAKSLPAGRKRNKIRSPMRSSVSSLLIVAVLWFVLSLMCRAGSGDQSRRAPSPAPSRDLVQELKDQVSMDYKGHKGGFNSVLIVDFVFTNPTPRPAKDITVTCTHYAPSGTEIDSNTRTIYETIPAKGKKTVKNFNMGFINSQATSTTCKIDNVEM